MDNLQLRQRIVRSMIRVGERTNNMRKPEKFEYRKHMTAAFMDMLELCIEANRARGQGGEPMDVTAIIIAASIPSAITGFCFWLIERNIKKQDKKRETEEEARREDMERRENLRQQQEFYLVQGVNAAIALGEATAKAVQRIPDAHCNGDMHAALEYASKVKHAQKDFLAKQGINSIYE